MLGARDLSIVGTMEGGDEATSLGVEEEKIEGEKDGSVESSEKPSNLMSSKNTLSLLSLASQRKRILALVVSL